MDLRGLTASALRPVQAAAAWMSGAGSGAGGGWRAGLASLALGALAVLGHAPFHAWPVFALALTGLALLLDGARASARPLLSGFWRAWAFGFGHFLAGMFWVGAAFLVEAERFALLMPVAVAILPAGLALFWGAAGALHAALWRPGPARVAGFAFAFALAEFARGHLFTGLPWNLPAYVWAAGGWISQNGAWAGPYGVTLATLFALAAPAVLVGSGGRRARTATIAAAALVALSGCGYGIWRLAQSEADDRPAAARPLVAAGHAGFSQRELFDPANRPAIANGYLNLLEAEAARGADLIVWPEGAFPAFLSEEEALVRAIGARLGTRTLAVGSLRRDMQPDGDTLYNSLFILDAPERAAIDGGVRLVNLYDKRHLVPFGEYLPFRGLFGRIGLESLVSVGGDMRPGPKAGPLAIPLRGAGGRTLKADARICYEIVFPAFAPQARGADFLLNVSVDAWYGDLIGPDQHFAQARWRAIETGLPLVRAASGGWSGIVDANGRVVAAHRRGAGQAVAHLPARMALPTLYSIFGNLWFVIALSITGVFCLFRRIAA